MALLRFDGAVERDPAIDAWIDAHPPALAAIARAWFGELRACGPDVRELMHDGLATACVADAPFAYVGIFRSHVNLGFFQGAVLPDPAGVLEGSGKRMRHVKLKVGQAVDAAVLERLVEAGYRAVREDAQDSGVTRRP